MLGKIRLLILLATFMLHNCQKLNSSGFLMLANPIPIQRWKKYLKVSELCVFFSGNENGNKSTVNKELNEKCITITSFGRFKL